MLVRLFAEVTFKGERNRFENEADWNDTFYFSSAELAQKFHENMMQSKSEWRLMTFGIHASEGMEETVVGRYLTFPTWEMFAVDLRYASTQTFQFTLEKVCDLVEKFYRVTVSREELRKLEQEN